MDSMEKKILDKIDSMRDEIVKFHQDFVRVPSVNPPGKYKEVSEFVEKCELLIKDRKLLDKMVKSQHSLVEDGGKYSLKKRNQKLIRLINEYIK